MTLPKPKQRKSEIVSANLSNKGIQTMCNKAFKGYRKYCFLL